MERGGEGEGEGVIRSLLHLIRFDGKAYIELEESKNSWGWRNGNGEGD